MFSHQKKLITLHHGKKFFKVDLTIFIRISLFDHCINFLVSEVFSKSNHNLLQFVPLNITITIFVKHFKRRFQFLLKVKLFILDKAPNPFVGLELAWESKLVHY